MFSFGRAVLKALVVLTVVVLAHSKEPPRFMQPTKSEYTVYEGDKVRLWCSVTGTNDPQHNRTLTAWKKFGGIGNGVIRKSSSSWRRYRVKNGMYLRIRNVKLDDAGSFLCVAKNQHGTITTVIKLIVKALAVPASNSTSSDVVSKRPTISTVSQRNPQFRNKDKVKAVTVEVGKQLKLRCHAKGNPTPKIKWYKHNKRLKRGRGKKISAWAFTVARVTKADRGIYSCFVWNLHGNITRTFFVQVKGSSLTLPSDDEGRKPSIQKHLLSNSTATVGKIVIFSCTALSHLVPRFTWLKWSVFNNTSNETVQITVLNSSAPNVRFVRESSRWSVDRMSYCHKLKLLNVTEADEGRYTCVVGTSVGFVSSDVYLTVNPKQSAHQDGGFPPSRPPWKKTVQTDIQIPLAALIAVPVAFGTLLIVAIIWCYIQTVRHRARLDMNSKALSFSTANGTGNVPNGLRFVKPTSNGDVPIETLANGNVVYETQEEHVHIVDSRPHPKDASIVHITSNNLERLATLAELEQSQPQPDSRTEKIHNSDEHVYGSHGNVGSPDFSNMIQKVTQDGCAENQEESCANTKKPERTKHSTEHSTEPSIEQSIEHGLTNSDDEDAVSQHERTTNRTVRNSVV